LSEKVTEDQERTIQTKEALHDVVAAANHVLDRVLAAAAVVTSGRTGGSNMGKKRRILMILKQRAFLLYSANISKDTSPTANKLV
jgi:hypothetical protein